MGTEKRPTIAIMAGNSVSEYSAELIAGFRACAKEEDVNLVFLMGPHMPQYCKDVLSESFAWDYDYQFHSVYDYVQFVKPDAIIIAFGSLSPFKYIPDAKEFVKRFRGIPCLLLGDRIDDPAVPCLTVGNYNGMYQCVEHLVAEHGYQKIAFVGGPVRNYDSNERLRAYRDVLQAHGIPVRDSMIVHGNYSEDVETEVEALLDNHPGLEAIVFANDSMAKTGYRVCAARNLRVGYDIAITGFDDVDIAKTLEPPLTSVAQSSFLVSYRAVKAALELCRGKKPKSEEMKAYFNRRESCGCGRVHAGGKTVMSPEGLQDFLAERIENILAELFSSIPYEKEKSGYRRLLWGYFQDVVQMVFEKKTEDISCDALVRYLDEMCRNPFISRRLLLEQLGQLLRDVAGISEGEQTRASLGIIMDFTRQYIHSEDVDIIKAELVRSNRNTWFIPSFTLDLINQELNLVDNMTHIMKLLQATGIKSAYLFFFAEAVIHRREEELSLPDAMYLTAYYNEQGMVCYRAKEMKPVRTGEGLTQLFPQNQAHFYTAFVLFSGEEQYGMLLCEAEQKDFPFMLVGSMQLGSLRRIINLNIRERQMKRELEEKNRILSFISAYDEMSQLLNRRGFMEKAIETVWEHQGKHAYFLFADIDHLKEINDCFGHAAGDFAIRTAAEYLRYCVPADAVVARIGGDEFVALIISDSKDGSEILTRRLQDYAMKFNISSKQPFYVEMSVGVYEFICDTETNIEELLCQSDTILYEQKKKRRKTIKKNAT